MLPLLLVVATWAIQDALLDAAVAGDADRIRSLIASGTDVNASNGEGRTALMEAAGRNEREIVALLLEAGADVTARDAEGVGALTIATAIGAAEIASMLRDAGARESPEELLDEAVRAGDEDAVKRLIAEGADVDALDTHAYQTPLMTALELRRLDILLLLVEAGADPTREGTGIETTGENAISFAARAGSPWALRLLVEARARQSDLDRALFVGCANASVIRVVVEAGASVHARGAAGETPLICAASAGAADAVSALLEAGADAKAVSAEGRTALDVARRNQHDDVAALLAR